MQNKFITVSFTHPTTSQVLKVELDPNLTAESIVNELLAINFISDNSPHDGYLLLIKDTGTIIQGSQTLAEGGVRNAGIIRVVPNVVAYGCPSAKQVKGLVPDCMLTEFEGLEPVSY